MVSVMMRWNRIVSVSIAMVLLAGGCANVPSDMPGADQSNRHRQTEMAAQEAKAESAALRADLASARIAMAKQETELRELRRQAEELRQAGDAKHTELIALRNERDRLAQTPTIAQLGVANPSALPASAADVAGLQTKVHEMESALTTLASELAQVKTEMAQVKKEMARSAAARKK
jgi:chromosome segregation ATPase